MLHFDSFAEFDGIGKREGFVNLYPEIDSLLEYQNSNKGLTSNTETNNIILDVDFGDAEWTFEKERRMSFECFNFPSEQDEFDEPLVERDILPRVNNHSKDVSDKLKDSKERGLKMQNERNSLSIEGISKDYPETNQNRYFPSVGRYKTPPSKASSLFKFKSRSSIINVNPSGQAGSTSPTNASQKTIMKSKKPIGRSLDGERHGGKKIGIYSPESRKIRLERFHAKREQRIWKKSIKYNCRKKLAEDRPRIRGRFVRRTDPNSSTNAKLQ